MCNTYSVILRSTHALLLHESSWKRRCSVKASCSDSDNTRYVEEAVRTIIRSSSDTPKFACWFDCGCGSSNTCIARQHVAKSWTTMDVPSTDLIGCQRRRKVDNSASWCRLRRFSTFVSSKIIHLGIREFCPSASFLSPYYASKLLLALLKV